MNPLDQLQLDQPADWLSKKGSLIDRVAKLKLLVSKETQIFDDVPLSKTKTGSSPHDNSPTSKK